MSMVELQSTSRHGSFAVNPKMVAGVTDYDVTLNMGGTGQANSRIPHTEGSAEAVLDKIKKADPTAAFISVEDTRKVQRHLNIDHIALVNEDGNIIMNYGGARDVSPYVNTTEFHKDIMKKIQKAERARDAEMGVSHKREIPRQFQDIAETAVPSLGPEIV